VKKDGIGVIPSFVKIVQLVQKSIIRLIKVRRRLAGLLACMGERRGAYSVLVGTPEGKRTLERSRRKWEDNVKMDFQ
jgi:hypothetical protein